MTNPTDAAIAQAWRNRFISERMNAYPEYGYEARRAKAEADANDFEDAFIAASANRARELDATYQHRINSGDVDNATPPAQAAESVQVAYNSGETLSKQAAEAVVVTDAMVEAAAKAIFFEETGYRLLDDDDPAHPGGYTVTYTRYARAAITAAIAAMRAGE